MVYSLADLIPPKEEPMRTSKNKVLFVLLVVLLAFTACAPKGTWHGAYCSADKTVCHEVSGSGEVCDAWRTFEFKGAQTPFILNGCHVTKP